MDRLLKGWGSQGWETENLGGMIPLNKSHPPRIPRKPVSQRRCYTYSPMRQTTKFDKLRRVRYEFGGSCPSLEIRNDGLAN